MKKILVLSAMPLLLSCNSGSNKKTDPIRDTTALSPQTEEQDEPPPPPDPLTDTLMKLPFIVKSNNYIDSFSNHRHGIAFRSDTSETEISVQAGYNGPERFETYYHFTIDRKTGEIKVMDPVEGDYIPLKDFLKSNQ